MNKYNKLIKSIISILLIFVMAHQNRINANENLENFSSREELIELASDYIQYFDFDANVFSSYYLGSEIITYDVNSKTNEYVLRDSMKIYPVYKDNEVIFTIIDMCNTKKISLEGVNGLNNIENHESNPFALVADGENCIAVNENKTVNVTMKNGKNTRNLVDNIFVETLNLQTIEKTNISYTPNASVYANALNMPIKGQHTNYTCWAGCMASFVHKYKQYNLTSYDICVDIADYYSNYSVSSLGQTMMSLINVSNFLDYVYNIKTTRDYAVTTDDLSTIKSSIDANNALIIGWRNSNNGGHATILGGYSNYGNGGAKYTIMDPMYINKNGGNYYLVTSTAILPTNSNINSSNIYNMQETLTYKR